MSHRLRYQEVRSWGESSYTPWHVYMCSLDCNEWTYLDPFS